MQDKILSRYIKTAFIAAIATSLTIFTQTIASINLAFADVAGNPIVPVTVSSGAIDSSFDATLGRPIFGYYVTATQDGQTQTGFTTATFNVIAGESFQLTAANYGNCVFDHW